MIGLEFDPEAPGYDGLSARVTKECLDRKMLLLPAGADQIFLAVASAAACLTRAGEVRRRVDDLRGQMSPKVVHLSPDLPRLSYGSCCQAAAAAVATGKLQPRPRPHPLPQLLHQPLNSPRLSPPPPALADHIKPARLRQATASPSASRPRS